MTEEFHERREPKVPWSENHMGIKRPGGSSKENQKEAVEGVNQRFLQLLVYRFKQITIVDKVPNYIEIADYLSFKIHHVGSGRY